MASIRQQVKDCKDLKEELYHVPVWEVDILLRSFDGEQREKIITSARRAGKKSGTELDFTPLYPNIVVMCSYEPDNPDKPVFSEADTDWLKKKHGGLLEKIAVKVFQLSAMDEKGLENAEKN